MHSKHPFWVMCCPVNVYCDIDILCTVIVMYHVLSNVQLMLDVECSSDKLFLWFTSRQSTSKNTTCCVTAALGLGHRLEASIDHQTPQRTQKTLHYQGRTFVGADA